MTTAESLNYPIGTSIHVREKVVLGFRAPAGAVQVVLESCERCIIYPYGPVRTAKNIYRQGIVVVYRAQSCNGVKRGVGGAIWVEIASTVHRGGLAQS